MQFESKNLMLATNMKGEPGDYSPGLWIAQPKWDGHRMVVSGYSLNGYYTVRYVKRNSVGELDHWASNKGPGRDWFPQDAGWTLDGEWLPLDRTYVVFDVLEWDGIDLRGMPLERRLAHLDTVQSKVNKKEGRDTLVTISPYGEPSLVMGVVDKYNLEGTVVKRRDSVYAAGRSANWQKLVHIQKAVWTFYVHKTEPKLVIVRYDDHQPQAVAVTEAVADELRHTLTGTSLPAHGHSYDFQDRSAHLTGNGVFRFWGWKHTRFTSIPRYVQYDGLADTPFDGTVIMAQVKEKSQTNLV